MYDHYIEAFYGTALYIVKSESLAEEVVQDSFMKIWERINKYDHQKGRLFTWMINIVRNSAIDKLRSREFSEQMKTIDITNFVDRKGLDQSSTYDTIGLREIMDVLDKNQRIIIELVYFSQYTQSEIAEELNIPLGTVKTRLRNALKVLRKHLRVD